MLRYERDIMTGWMFALGEPLEENYRPVCLPHDWAIDAPFNRHMDEGGAQGYRDRFGVGWYRRSLVLAAKREDRRYFLDFGGIYENSTVYVNGEAAGGQRYGYSSFRLEVTALLRTGDNQILIKVDNTQRPADRWYSGCGLYRMVKCIETGRLYLDEREITVRSRIMGKDAEVTVDTGTDMRVRACLRLGDSCCTAEGEGRRLTLPVKDARLWSAESPNLYALELTLFNGGEAVDALSLRIGIREISLDAERGMRVNGQPVLLKGVCVHQDVGCRGIAAKKEIWRRRLGLLKEMGCNAIRPSHHTFSAEFLDLCDEMGFYVYEECFDKWTGGLYGRYFQSDWQKDVDAMVKRDRNRPCIFLWGVGNEVENQGQASMLELLRSLVDYVKKTDETRPVTYAMNPHFKRETNVDVRHVKDIQAFVDVADDAEIYDMEERLERIGRIAALVDVISCNYQEQWYPLIHARCPDKPILGTEVYQFFKGHPEQMQNYTDENPSLVPMQLPYVIGGMIWSGYDYLGESMGYPAKGWSGAVIRTNLEKRPSYYILKSYWTDAPMVHFSVMDYSLLDEGVKEHWDMPPYADHWHFPQFHRAVVPYMVATNCEQVALFVGNKRYYLPAPKACPNGVITGFLPYVPGTVRVIGYQGGEAVCSHEVTTPGAAAALSFEEESRTVPREEGYEVLLTVRARDEEGVACVRESAWVRFGVEGDAQIVGVDNGCLMGSEPYGEHAIHMYRGAASVQVRCGGSGGRFAVYAHAEGLRPGRVTVVPQDRG